MVKITLNLCSSLNFLLSPSSLALLVAGIIKKQINEKETVTKPTIACGIDGWTDKKSRERKTIPKRNISVNILGNIFLI